MTTLPGSNVYFARCIGPLGDIGAVKVGLAKDVAKRVASVGTQLPFKCEPITSVPGDLFTENFVQMWCREHCISGEYFRPEGEVLRLIEYASAHARLPMRMQEGKEDWPTFDWLDWCGFMASRGITLKHVEFHTGCPPKHYQKIVDGKLDANRRFYAALAVTAVRMGFAVHWPRDFRPVSERKVAA